MKRVHAMPFGATVLDSGGVRFRLWAPAARAVELCIEEQRTAITLPLHAQADGWFELETPQARAGSRYRYRIDGDLLVPDPAARFNPGDVHGASAVVDPAAFDWQDGNWRGRRWDEAVIYELHVGTFSPEGDFQGVERRLDYLEKLGVTALELMPVADFSGARNWGYDGVLPFAPDSSYGRPEQLKHLIQSAHARGLMVLLDVVYNHFGPDGNYLHAYAPQFFTERYHTPWGGAINFADAHSRTVRGFFIHNALYWLEEFHFDGLRLDAVHAIRDESIPDILVELAEAVRLGPGQERAVHLVLENDRNQASYLQRDASGRARLYNAQWNDDIHHALHLIATGERDGYYADYADRPLWHLGRCLTQGFAFQGDPSPFRGGETRGEPSAMLPPAAFIAFLQNHDQVGNRALGERLCMTVGSQRLRALTALWLLAPSPPLLFMGEEFGARTPFLFFCDFHGELAEAVREGRRREFARFERFRDPQARGQIPDPNLAATFERSKLDWSSLDADEHRQWLELYAELLALRRDRIVPLLHDLRAGKAAFQLQGSAGLQVTWELADEGRRLTLLANLSDQVLTGVPSRAGTEIYASHAPPPGGQMAPWSVVWLLDGAAKRGAA
jgi:malto-oligosyltrehalose trehalohydrolase